MHIVAIVAAAGSGFRMGAEIPKQFLALGDTTVLGRSLDAFDRHPRVDEIIVVLPTELTARYAADLSSRRTPTRVVGGGPRRQDSVAMGFALVPHNADLVAVHDAARPFVSAEVIDRTLDAALENGAAIAALVAQDTVKLVDRADGSPFVDTTLPRDTIYLAQTPQVFRRSVLEDGLAFGAAGMEVTDEAMLVERAGHTVRLVDGDLGNVKLTTARDLEIARARVERSEVNAEMRIGIGYDLHRLVEGRSLVLGGVTIPHESGLLGHSDADAVCHALADAILGAAAAGDIGQHFPDSDRKWKDASSLDLLAGAYEIVRNRGFAVRNVDVVVIAEAPRLGPYIDAMRENIAASIGMTVADVGIKGKTNEGIGPLGHGEAIAVHAIAQLGPADHLSTESVPS
ncbi:MAG: 2-C-methyl-D-erythritol 4-phosphate cytidylyltransferase [Acidobacteriota bacterium]|nr:2-C-methyl-D-erythritol 4-phosphate cytidylyltransferase [Acidobacteriota bacterium]